MAPRLVAACVHAQAAARVTGLGKGGEAGLQGTQVGLLGGAEGLGERALHLGERALGDVARGRHAHLQAAREHDGQRGVEVTAPEGGGVEAKHAARPTLEGGEGELVEPVLGVVGEHVHVLANQVRHVADDDDGEQQVAEEGLELLRPVPAPAGPGDAAGGGGHGEARWEGVAHAG